METPEFPPSHLQSGSTVGGVFKTPRNTTPLRLRLGEHGGRRRPARNAARATWLWMARERR